MLVALHRAVADVRMMIYKEINMLRQQRTLKQSVSCYGMGLHSGLIVNMTLRPLPPFAGVVFQRLDLEGQPRIKASYENISGTEIEVKGNIRDAQTQTGQHRPGDIFCLHGCSCLYSGTNH